MRRATATLAIFVLAMSACSSDSDTTTETNGNGSTNSDQSSDGDPGIDIDDFIEDPQAAADELADTLEDRQSSQGGGSAILTVGDQTWTFDSVLCAFGEEQIGQEGAEFVLSSIQDGLQMYASIDSFGHSVSLNDIEDFENPSVSLDAFGGEFIDVDGKSVRADVELQDGTTDDFVTLTGMFEATCP